MNSIEDHTWHLPGRDSCHNFGNEEESRRQHSFGAEGETLSHQRWNSCCPVEATEGGSCIPLAAGHIP